MLKRQYLGYVILGLGLILLTIVVASQPESVSSQRNSHSMEWVKPLAISVLCENDDCSLTYSAKVQPSANFSPRQYFDSAPDNQTCTECHSDGIATDIDFLVSPQEMTHQLQVRFLTVSKRVFALQPTQDDSQYQAMMESYMQIHHQQVLEHPSGDPTEVGNALHLLTTVENLVNQVESNNRWTEITSLPFITIHDAVPPHKCDKKCGIEGVCQEFIQSIKPPASSPEKHVSDTPIAPIEIKWSVSRRGPPAYSTLISSNTRRLQPFIDGRSSFVLESSIIIPTHRLFQCSKPAKEQFIERTVVQKVSELRLHVTASKHLEKSLR